MTQYLSQTDSVIIPLDENKTSEELGNGEESYRFNPDGVAFKNLTPGEEISKEDEVKFYRKVFETKNI